MSYQLVKTDANVGTVDPPKIVKQIDQSGQTREKKAINKISKKHVINHLNYINFQDNSITVNLKHTRFGRIVSLQAIPQPCTGDALCCTWINPSEVRSRLKTYEFENISLKYGDQNLILKPELINIDISGINLELSELYYPLHYENNIHQPCKGIKAQLIQNSIIFDGILTDFCATSFHVKISLVPPQTSQWINSDSSIEIILSNESETLYSGACSIIEDIFKNDQVDFLLKPLTHHINRFKQKKYRSLRETIFPTPNILFRHPITDNLFELKLVDLSGSGFSVEEDSLSSMLLPGMIIPNIVMSFTKNFKIKLKAQVVYRKNIDPEINGSAVKFGLVIIDIDSENHNDLMGILHQAQNENSYINNEIDLNELWDFFFDSGFIYPEKYSFLQKYKDRIKRTFKTVYTQGSDIAKHFVFQKQGHIQSHMSTIRFYEKSWLIHHHAARRATFNSSGLSVLNQIGRFINDSHRLYSTKMNFVFCYFRTNNKFPDRVFGGASRIIKDPKACSLDSFAYFHFHNSTHNTMIPFAWELEQTNPEDLFELGAFYKIESNGLMIDALDLNPSHNNLKEISNDFKKIGLKRERHLYSLKKEGVLKAIIMVNSSDIGLNLSELTNSTTIFILDSDGLPNDVFKKTISLIASRLSMTDSPVLLYPTKYITNSKIHYEHTYNLWVLNMKSTDHYFRYLTRLLRFVRY